jgi:hypothetical protein
MTTFVFFAELIIITTKPNEATTSLYEGLVETSEPWFYAKWR